MSTDRHNLFFSFSRNADIVCSDLTVKQVFFSHASNNGKRLHLQQEPFNIKPNLLQPLGGVYFIYWGGRVGGKET